MSLPSPIQSNIENDFEIFYNHLTILKDKWGDLKVWNYLLKIMFKSTFFKLTKKETK